LGRQKKECSVRNRFVFVAEIGLELSGAEMLLGILIAIHHLDECNGCISSTILLSENVEELEGTEEEEEDKEQVEEGERSGGIKG
jgi:hypothetical protein